MTARVLDRLEEFDSRSKQFPVRSALTSIQPRSYTWPCSVVLDQGREGACVGFAWAHEAAAVPREHHVSEAFAHDVYREARTVDAWPGEDYEGTSVLAGAKVMQRRGLISSYRWAFGVVDALAAISRKGPVVMGLPWYTGMFDADPDGFIHPTGIVEGGHAIMGVGVNVRGRYAVLHNSWGPRWGRLGRCRINWDDLDGLLRQHGEVCVPIR